jgi:hypothetical protein
MNQENNYFLLINKLDEFIRKYYKNQVIRGSIYMLAALVGSFILINVTEYYFYLNTVFRGILFYFFLIFNISLFIFLIGIPAFHFYKLGKIINHSTAARIIGEHFREVKDKLLNTLQLHEMAGNHAENNSLITASINQKIEQLKPIPFTSAIDLSKNKKYLKYALIPLSIFLVIIFTAPSIITESSNRLINYNVFYEKPAPFQFNIENKKLEAIQGDDYELSIKMTGAEIPQDIYLLVDDHQYKLEKNSIINFAYTFKNIQKTKKFSFLADGFSSRTYELNVLSKPSVLHFTIQLDYPAYLNRKDERISNIGDLTIPQGTNLKWTFTAENTEEILLNFNGQKESITSENNTQFSFAKKAMKNSIYSLSPLNKNANNKDSIAYSLQVIPDLFPGIEVDKKEDSLSSKIYYFIGQIKDDYGFTKLNFHYRKRSSGNNSGAVVQNIPVSKNKNNDQFFYYWNLGDINIQPGEDVEYYFEVWDNDGVNGAKSAKSSVQTFKAPTLKEIDKNTEENNSSFKDKMSETIKQSEQIQREAKRLNEKLINKKNLSFEEKKQVKDLLEKQQQLEKAVEELQKQNEQNNREEQEYKNIDENILEKKKQLEDLFENVLDEKTKEMIKELERLLDQNNKEMTQDQLQKMQLDNKNMEKELDRMLELYKQLEFEQKLNDNIDKLEDLSKKQEQLSEESKQKNSDTEKLKEKQDQLNQELKDLKEEMKSLENKNEALEEPNDFENPEKEMQEIDNDMQKSSEELEKNKKDKASQSQKNASQQMKQLANKMKSKQANMEMEEIDLNIQALREILENLVKISFDQEQTMQELKKTNTNDPKYLTLTQKQKLLKDDLKMVEDSLYALSKKVMQIQSFVNKEITQINQNMQKSIENLADRRTGEATSRQQYVMTSVNNLAVMLSEILQQMQAEMKAMQEGQKPGSKPGKKQGKSPGNSLSKMQGELNKQLEQLKNGMQPGQKPGKGQMSEQMARMAAQQQAIRNALQEMEKEMNNNKDGKGSSGNAGEFNKLKKEMEKTETDLYNKNITQEMINRQKDILSRLLESEKAMREREYDNKREAESAKDKTVNYNIVFEEYQKQKTKELELLKTVPPTLKPYYKGKVNDYFDKLRN